MATSVILIALLCYHFCSSYARDQTTVEVTLPYRPITVGGILAISCEIRNIQAGYTVSFFREFNGNTDKISEDYTYYPSSLLQRIFISKRATSGSTTVYFMTLVDVSHDDQGQYICSVSSMKNRRLVEIATNSLAIEILSFPRNLYPICQGIPNMIRVNIGTKLRFICTSEKTNPVVELQWSSNKEYISSPINNLNNDDTISSEITIVTKSSHNGVSFVCTMKSIGFPERQRTCFVGPIAVISRTNEHGTIVIGSRDRELSNTQNRDPNRGSDLRLSNGCDMTCPAEDTNAVLYLATGTMAATILMLTFLTTTIILCCKYYKISGEVRAVQRNISCSDGSDPVYVSLQRRPEPDRSSMYMSVEDPHNPGNKVLMPRELVEEFYRSLSLKRKK